MLLLVSTSDKVQVVTSSTATTDVRADYIDAPNPITSGATQTPGNKGTAITTATTTDVVAAPSASTVRNVKRLSIANKHASTAQTVTVQVVNASGTVVVVPAMTLQHGESLVVSGDGFVTTYDAQGKIKNSGFTSAGGSNPQVQYADATSNLAGAANVEIDADGDANLVANASPNPPSSNRVKLFGRAVAMRIMPAFMGPSGLDSALQPFLARNKVGYWDPPGNATTVPGVFGITAPTAVGTATSRTVAVTNLATRMRRLGYVSSATAGNLCGHYVPAAQFTVGDGGSPPLGGMTMIARFVPSDPAVVSGARGFVGLSNSVAAPTNVEPSSITNCIGVAQLSTSTNMQIVYGGSAAQTPIDLGSSFPFSTASVDAYELALFLSPLGTVFYQVTRLNTGDTASGQLTGTTGVALPLSSTLLAYRAWRCNNATALATGIDICSVYIETDS